jgi:hypothetical protein
MKQRKINIFIFGWLLLIICVFVQTTQVKAGAVIAIDAVASVVKILGSLANLTGFPEDQDVAYIANNTPTALRVKLNLSACTDPDSIVVQACQIGTITSGTFCVGVQKVKVEDPDTKDVFQSACYDAGKTQTGVIITIDGSKDAGYTIALYTNSSDTSDPHFNDQKSC